MASRPVVGIICDTRREGGMVYHQAGDEYLSAVIHGANALPLLIPAAPVAPQEILEHVDGLLFTGAVSNVEPALYDGAPPRPGSPLDPARDAVSLPLMRAAIAQGLPILCICRGFQELNVAFGGSLHQHLVEIPGRLDHREKRNAPLEDQYGPSHDVAVATGGLLARLLTGSIAGGRIAVNSLHHQGIDRLAAALHADAQAPDGQIEAVSMPGATGFLLGVQWHPEWRWAENPVSRAIFQAFGAAMAARAAR